MTTRNFNVKNGLTVGVANIDATTGNILTTGIANVGSLAVSGVSNLGPVGNVTITGGSLGYYLQTNGSGVLTWAAVPAGTGISNGTSNVNIPAASSTIVMGVAGATVANFTSTGLNVFGTLNSTGNANVGNLGTAQVLATANITSPQLISNIATGTAPLIVTSTTRVANLNVATSGVANTVNDAAQPNITSVGTLTSLAVTSNVTAGNLIGPHANGNSNVSIATAAGNVTIFVNGNANARITATDTGANVIGTFGVTGNANVGNLGAAAGVFTGTLNVTGNANIGNVGTAQVLASANVIAPQLISNVSTGTAPLVVSSTTVVTNLNADLLDGLNSASAATASTIVARDANANVAANFFIGNGSQLTGITATQVSGISNGSSNINIVQDGQINLVANTTTTMFVTKTGANIAGTANISGNANVGNLGTAGLITATGNVSGGNLTTGGVLTVSGTGVSSISGNLNMNSKWVVSLSDPVNNQDAATKAYVDNFATTGISFHTGVAAATTTTLATATGGTMTYNNGASGVGANLVTTGSFNLIDTANVQTVGTRILVKDEANAAWNGVYTWANASTIVRSTDTDSYGPDSTTDLSINDYFFVNGGQVNKNTSWIVSAPSGVITFGTSNITFSQFSSVQSYTANATGGLTLYNDNSFGISNTTVTAGSYGSGDAVATFTVNARGQLTAASNTAITANAANLTGTTLNSSIVTSSLTTVGTLGSLTVTGNATAGNFVGRLANGNSNINIPTANSTVFISVAGTPNVLAVTATGANIAGTANVSGNANVGNIGAAAGVFTGNVTAGNANVTGQLISTIATGTAPLVVTSNTLVSNLNADLLDGFNSATAATASTIALRDANGNISGNFFIGNGSQLTGITGAQVTGIANGSSNVNIVLDGNVNIVANTTTTMVITKTGANIAGTANISGNANVGNLGTSGLITATGNVSGGNITTSGQLVSTISTGTSPLSVTSTTVVTNLNANLLNGATTATANTASTIALRDANGNISANFFIGNGSQLTGITATQVSGISNGSSNINIVLDGNLNFVANTTTTMVVTKTGANITGTANISGNANVGNIGAAAGVFTANVTAGNVYANSGTIGASLLTGTITTNAQPNITSLGTLTGLTVNGNASANYSLLNTGIVSNRTNVAVTSTATVIDQFSPSTFRVAKYIVMATASGANTGYQAAEVLLVQDGSNAFITIYGDVLSNTSPGADVIDITANINGVSGNVTLYAAANTSFGATANVNVVPLYLKP
jgi:hypothetical protein